MPTSSCRSPRSLRDVPASGARRVTAGLAASVLATAVLAGCGTGSDQEPVQIYNAPEGQDIREGLTDVLGTVVVVDDSGNGTVVAGMIGPTDTDDSLVGVEATASDGQPLEAAIAGGEVPVPAGQLAKLPGEAAVTLTGDGLEPGTLVDMTFSFQVGGPVSGAVPIVTRDNETYANVPLPEVPATEANGRAQPGGAEEPTEPAPE